MQYQVVCGQDSSMRCAMEELEKKVKKLCQEGWKPQGGISIAVNEEHEWYYACQAMVK